MGLHLTYGGHLTHGWKVNFSGRYYEAVQYTTGADGWLDYDALARQVLQEHPKLLFVGATAYPRLFDWKRLREIADTTETFLVADISHIAGLIVGRVLELGGTRWYAIKSWPRTLISMPERRRTGQLAF